MSRKIPFSTATAGADGAIIYLEQDKTVIPIGDTVNLIAKDSTGEVIPVTWNIADSSILEIITESGDGSSIQLKGLNPG